jgi:alanine racemase
MLTHQLTPVVSRFEDLEALASLKCKHSVDIHIKFNTGMTRLGFDESQLPELRKTLATRPEIRVEGLCTHLTHGEEAEVADGFSDKQFHKLKIMAEGFSGRLHAHKSASLCAYAKSEKLKAPGIGARPGIAIYGLPHEGREIGPGLKPVLRWSTRLTHIHKVKPGTGVSYGSRWQAERPSVIGVLPVGYGDGYSRDLSGKAPMLFRGRRVKNVGTVCMDYVMVDLTDVIQEGLPQAGEEIVLLGRQGGDEISAGELAELAGTIAYEIVTTISTRVVREI